MIATVNSIKAEVNTKGFVHIKYSTLNDTKELINTIGDVILNTEIRENPSSTRLLSSNKSMGFHTDHHKAKYIAWFCHSQSATGGESLLLDTFQLIKGFSEASQRLLTEVYVKSHHVFHDDKLSYPLLKINDENKIESVYYAPWLVNTPGCIKHIKALDNFETALANARQIDILLSEGDLLIIDNHRMLHGRNGFPASSNRWLTRYWISENEKSNPK